MELIDYVFYRVYSFYKKKKDSTPIWMACLVLSGTLFFSLFSLLVIANSIIKGKILEYINKPIAAGFLFLLILFFWLRYNQEKRVYAIEEKYSNEVDFKKRRRAVYIALYIAVVLLTPMIYGYMKHNLKIDI